MPSTFLASSRSSQSPAGSGGLHLALVQPVLRQWLFAGELLRSVHGGAHPLAALPPPHPRPHLPTSLRPPSPPPQVNQALLAYPEHTESHELLKQLKAHFTML